MKISILGTGIVGQTIAAKMTELKHEVFMGTRDAAVTSSRIKSNPMSGKSFPDWHKSNPVVSLVNYQDLPDDTDVFINATGGQGSIAALESVGHTKLEHKVILDIANPLDFSQGMPPSLYVCNTDSLAEQIQKEFPGSQIVKSLNTMNCFIMVNPGLVKGDHTVFMSGNDREAKAKVKSLLEDIGWNAKNILDLGDITTARGTEMLLPVWLRLWGALGTADFNFHIVRN